MTASKVVRAHNSVVWVFFLALAPAAVRAQQCPARPTENPVSVLATVRYLAADALEGRLAGTPGERCAGDYIADRFRQIGLEKGGSNDSYFQSVPLASSLNPHAPQGTGRNVIGLLHGGDARLRNEWIVVGAHYDHLGHGEFGSTAPDQVGAIHNGADDNASGVAALLEVATRLQRERPARSILFVAFTGEESGLLGSSQFVAEPAVPLDRMRAMVNMDMVGRLADGSLIINGTGTAMEWDALLKAAAAAEHLSFDASPEGYGPSDHTSFYMKDIPVLHFFTNVHGDYHKPSDDWEKIDVPGLEHVAGMVTRVVRSLAGPGQALSLVRGAGRPPAPAGQNQGYSSYLGTVPDFRPVDKGVLLSGVTPGSPGDKAGLRAGDIIIRFDTQEIADLQGMTDALRARQPGDSVRVTVLRDGKEVTVSAVLGRRGE